ncbi:MAG: FAD-binding oxidoreductase [Frankiaceae bacterium]|nr:FAD-binding oxidoreductase [Frankiaceae bacterium]
MTESLTQPRPETAGTGVVRPTTVAEAAQVLSGSTGSVLFRGGATQLDWAGRVPDPDLVVDTTDLSGVLTHNPGDMTASVRAGTTLIALQDQLAGAGQWLALDPPTASAGATVGGLLATGDSGPSRLRYGGIRDLVIGVTIVLADGTVARSGGHVIKNVAGYDLAKLVHGSLGSLALVAEVVVRLHPLPERSVTFTGDADAAQATAAALALAASPLEPAAVEWASAADAGRLLVRVDGTEASVDAAGRSLTELLAGLGVTLTALSAPDATSAWQAHAAAVVGSDDETVVRVAGLPSDLADLAGSAQDAARVADLRVVVVSSAALGMHTVRLSGGSPTGHAQALTQLRGRALERGASVLLRRRSPELDGLVEALGPPPSSADLLRRIKAEFDPTGRCAPGRFSPWF